MKKELIIIVFALMLILPVVAAESSLGTFKQNECITLLQTCANCTYNNITSIILPSGQITLDNVAMTKAGTIYNYTFCGTYLIGTHVVNGFGDTNGLDAVWTYTFEVTPSGFTGNLGFFIVLLLVIAAITTLGFYTEDGWFIVFGGLGLIVLGVYTLNNGIAGFRDMYMTWASSLIMLGVGAYLSVNAALHIIDEQEIKLN